MPAIPQVLHQGLAADKPTADPTKNQGFYYYETDTQILRQSWNGAWVVINLPATPNIMVKLDEVVVPGGGQPTIDFPAISGAYKDLRLVGYVRSTDAADSGSVHLTLNGDTGGNYDYMLAYFFNTSSGTTGGAAQTAARLGDMCADTAQAGSYSRVLIDIPGYADTHINKMLNAFVGEQVNYSSTGTGVEWCTAYWRSSAAITQVTLTPSAGDWKEYSRIALYGLN